MLVSTVLVAKQSMIMQNQESKWFRHKISMLLLFISPKAMRWWLSVHQKPNTGKDHYKSGNGVRSFVLMMIKILERMERDKVIGTIYIIKK